MWWPWLSQVQRWRGIEACRGPSRSGVSGASVGHLATYAPWEPLGTFLLQRIHEAGTTSLGRLPAARAATGGVPAARLLMPRGRRRRTLPPEGILSGAPGTDWRLRPAVRASLIRHRSPVSDPSAAASRPRVRRRDRTLRWPNGTAAAPATSSTAEPPTQWPPPTSGRVLLQVGSIASARPSPPKCPQCPCRAQAHVLSPPRRRGPRGTHRETQMGHRGGTPLVLARPDPTSDPAHWAKTLPSTPSRCARYRT